MKDQKVSKVVIAAACFLFSLTASAGFAQTPRQQAWTILQSGATDKSSQKRAAAVTVLALIPGDDKAMSMAEQALQDQDPGVRKAAADTLGTLKAKSAVPKLLDALKDTDGGVMMAAAKALVMMGNESGYEFYYAVVTGEHKSGASLMGGQEQELQHLLHNPKEAADMAFEQGIGFVPIGAEGFAAYQMIRQNAEKDAVVKATAIKILAQDPDPRSGKALINETGDKQWLLRAASYDAIARRGDPSLLPDITKGLADEHDEVRLTAAAAVAQLSTLSKNQVSVNGAAIPGDN
jgi:HEAT repeat protein